MTVPHPSQTLYVQHLNEKIKKPELKRSLHCLFSQYGRVLDIVALKTIKMRGQAFVAFDDIASASLAMKALQGFSFYDKAIKISYSKTKSKAILIKEGQYRPLAPGGGLKRKKDDDDEANRALMEEEEEDEEDGDTTTTTSHKKRKEEDDDQEDSNVEPNKLLLLSNLPSDITDASLSHLFQQYPGFKEIRLVPGKAIAFAEYSSAGEAAAAKSLLNGFKLKPDCSMKVSFAK